MTLKVTLVHAELNAQTLVWSKTISYSAIKVTCYIFGWPSPGTRSFCPGQGL